MLVELILVVSLALHADAKIKTLLAMK